MNNEGEEKFPIDLRCFLTSSLLLFRMLVFLFLLVGGCLFAAN